MEIERIVDITDDDSYSDDIRKAAYRLLQLKEAMLFHVPPGVVTTTTDHSAPLSRHIDHHASLFAQGRFDELIKLMIERRSVLRANGVKDRTIGQLIVAAVRMTKCKQARQLNVDQAAQREVPRRLPSVAAVPIMKNACSRVCAPHEDYSTDYCFQGHDRALISNMLRDHPVLFTGAAIKAGCKID